MNAGIAKLETPGAGPDLLRLVELLRSAGFLIGASEAIDASRLVCRLAELDPGMQSRASLRAKLRPIFCKSAEEQTRFDGIFQQWVNEQSTPPGSGKKFVETTAPEHVGSAVTESVKKKRSRRMWLWWTPFVVALAAVATWYWFYWNTVIEPPKKDIR